MSDLFATIVLGHLVGDYALQTNWMAMNKSASTFKCLVHCLVYTTAVSATTWPCLHGWLWSAVVFASHFLIDRWGLADKWLTLIGGRSLSGYLDGGKHGIPEGVDPDNYHALRGGFTSLVYAVTDNTMHLLVMWYAAKGIMSWA